MEDVRVAGAPARSGHRPRGRVRLALRGLGILFIVAGLAIGGYVGWTLWGTGLTTERWQKALRPVVEDRIRRAREHPAAPPVATHLPGNAIGIIEIPRIHLNMVVVEGTDTDSLKKGPGHYTDTAYPWQNHGRVGIAGHRTTYLHPFYSLDALGPGDRIVLVTAYGTFRYLVTRTLITGPDGILPNGQSVLQQTDRPTLVLTTCNPRYSAAQRLVVFADRAD